MPIYAYRCESCGFAKDVLQKISDPVLTDCPECGKSTFKKQVTAAGFQLKGTGWYATDFRGGGTPKTSESAVAAPASSSDNSKSGDSPATTQPPAATTPAASGTGNGGNNGAG